MPLRTATSLTRVADITGMFHKTGAAMTVCGAEDEHGISYDSKIELEGFTDDQLRQLRVDLRKPPPPITHETIEEMLLEVKEKRLVAWCEERKLSTSQLKGCEKKRSLARRLAQDGWGDDICDPQYLDGTTPPEGDGGDYEGNDEIGSEGEGEDEDPDEATKYMLEDSDDDDSEEPPEDNTRLTDFVAAATEDRCVCATKSRTCSPGNHVAIKRRGGWVLGRVVRAVHRSPAGYVRFGTQRLRQNMEVYYINEDTSSAHALLPANYCSDLTQVGMVGHWCRLVRVK